MIPPKHKPLEKNVSFGLELAAGFATLAGSPVCNLWSHSVGLNEVLVLLPTSAFNDRKVTCPSTFGTRR